MADSHPVASGVQELIDRLRDDGVRAGEREAQRLMEEARRKASQIIAEAKQQTDEYRDQARTEIERERGAAKEALQLAVRDTVLEMKTQLSARFAAQVQRLVSLELRDKEFLRQMILAIAARASAPAKDSPQVTLLLADELFGDAPAGPEAQKALRENLLAISAELLREGVELMPAGDNHPGMRIRLAKDDVEIDLTERAISEAVLQHLLPRFRAMVEGTEPQS
jgi:V/A-type H+-transporting ATPase subunit E